MLQKDFFANSGFDTAETEPSTALQHLAHLTNIYLPTPAGDGYILIIKPMFGLLLLRVLL